jgi:hypothetical protein
LFSNQSARSALFSALVASLLLLPSVGAATASGQATQPACDRAVHFDGRNFTDPTKIDNKWLPLAPGTQLTLEGSTSEGTHTVVLSVTDLTKVINGVRSVVLWDRDYQAGQLAESELAFEAQDSRGNVWNLGEYPEEYENGVFLGAPQTWIAGLARATAGIHMLAQPWVGSPSYVQGRAPAIDFLDCGQVSGSGQSICVPVACYENVLVINEWSPLDPSSGIQVKYYAPGVGNVQIGAVGDPEAETLVLTSLVHLSPGSLAKVRREACKLDERGYRSSEVYGATSPAEYQGHPCIDGTN